jgi:Na+/glutamate symporter
MWQLQWVLNLIPDNILIWVYYLLTFAGFALYIGSKLVKLIPFMGQYKLPAEITGVIVLCGSFWLMGGYGVEMAWRDRAKEMQAKVEAAEVKSKETNIVIQTKIVERVKVVEKKVEVVRNIIERDKEAINAQCTVSDIAVKDYNAAIAAPEEAK